MRLYIFRSEDQLVKLKIDRTHKKFEIATTLTNYRFIPQPYWKLFGDDMGDKEKAIKEMEEMELLQDTEFDHKLIEAFAKRGYTLITRR